MDIFNNFVKTHLNLTTHSESTEWMRSNCPDEDIYIVGSDQVWAKGIVGEFINSYLFDFVTKRAKLISYAASTGVGLMEDNLTIRDLLSRFSSISVREASSIEQLKSMTGKDVVDVCDPSLLIAKDDYAQMEQKVNFLPKKYILYFNLSGDFFCSDCAKQMSKQLKLPIVNVIKYKRFADRNIIVPTPQQWLYLFSHATYVCTNSFHGVTFSIINRKQFIYCEPKIGGRAKNNGRIINLLNHTNLSKQYVTDLSQLTSLENLDYTNNEEAIEDYRNSSFDWLQNAILK